MDFETLYKIFKILSAVFLVAAVATCLMNVNSVVVPCCVIAVLLNIIARRFR